MGDGQGFFRAVSRLGLEGIGCQAPGQPLRAGKRSGSWLKVKRVQAQELVVGGFTEGTGARSENFGALLVGYYDEGELRYAGRVGSGFDSSTLAELSSYLRSVTSRSPPLSRTRSWTASTLVGSGQSWLPR